MHQIQILIIFDIISILQNWGTFSEEMKFFELVNFSKLFLGTTGIQRNYLGSFLLCFQGYVFSGSYILLSSISQQVVEISVNIKIYEF